MGKVFGCVLVAFCFLAMADAATKKPPKKVNPEAVKERALLHQAIETLQRTHKQLEALSDEVGNCICKSFTCRCCFESMSIPSCASVVFNRKEKTVTVTLEVLDTSIVKETVSASRPYNFCVSTPEVDGQKLPGFCLDLYDLKIAEGIFTGCVKITFNALVGHVHFDFGCVKLPME